MAINKVIYGGNTLIDLTADTVIASGLASGLTAHDKSGAVITGTNTYDADTSDATATAAEILLSKTAYVNGVKLTGTMPNNGGTNVTVSSTSGAAIPQGYSDGSAKAVLDASSLAALIASNIKDGVSILGITGTYTGEGATATAVNITPSTSAQTILPPTGYDYISQANVAAIPYTETDNAAGGKTATIG